MKSLKLPQPTYVPRLLVIQQNVSKQAKPLGKRNQPLILQWVKRFLIALETLSSNGSLWKKEISLSKIVRYFLSFPLRKNSKRLCESYFPEIIRRSETIKKEEEMVKLYSRESGCLDGRAWRSVNLEHPATFEKLAMEPELKKMVKDDLDRFVRRKELYKKVGKA